MKTTGKKSVFVVFMMMLVMMVAVVPVSATKKKHTHRYKVTRAATCVRTGTKKCSCGASKTIKKNANAHSWTSATSSTASYKAPTCTQSGFGYKEVCKLCKTPKLKSRYTIKALGHKYDKKGVCTRCKRHK